MRTAARIEQLSRLAAEERSYEEMLIETGLSPGMLNYFLTRAGLRKPRRYRLNVRLGADTTSALILEAGRRGWTPVQLAKQLIETIAKDKLYAAILDD